MNRSMSLTGRWLGAAGAAVLVGLLVLEPVLAEPPQRWGQVTSDPPSAPAAPQPPEAPEIPQAPHAPGTPALPSPPESLVSSEPPKRPAPPESLAATAMGQVQPPVELSQPVANEAAEAVVLPPVEQWAPAEASSQAEVPDPAPMRRRAAAAEVVDDAMPAASAREGASDVAGPAVADEGEPPPPHAAASSNNEEPAAPVLEQQPGIAAEPPVDAASSAPAEATEPSSASARQRPPRTLEQLQQDFGGSAPDGAAFGQQDEAGKSGGGAGGESRQPGAGWVLNIVGALVLVIALIYLLRWGLVKFTGRLGAVSQSPVLEVLARVAVAPRSNVLLLRMGHRILAVGETAAGMQTLAEFRDGDEMAALLQAVGSDRVSQRAGSFSQLLGRFGREHEPVTAAQPDSAGFSGTGDDDAAAGDHLDRARSELSGLRSRLRTLGSRGIEA